MSTLSNAKHITRLNKIVQRLDIEKSYDLFMDGPGCPEKVEWVKAAKHSLDLMRESLIEGSKNTSKNVFKELYFPLEHMYKRKDKHHELEFHGITLTHLTYRVRLTIRFAAGNNWFGLQKVLVTDLTDVEVANIDPLNNRIVGYEGF